MNRSRSLVDRRKVLVGLTPAGMSRLGEAPPPLLETRFQNRFQSLPDWERSLIVSALQRVASLMDGPDLDRTSVLETAANAGIAGRNRRD